MLCSVLYSLDVRTVLSNGFRGVTEQSIDSAFICINYMKYMTLTPPLVSEPASSKYLVRHVPPSKWILIVHVLQSK